MWAHLNQSSPSSTQATQKSCFPIFMSTRLDFVWLIRSSVSHKCSALNSAQYSGSVHKDVIRKQEINESEILVLHLELIHPSRVVLESVMAVPVMMNYMFCM